MFKDTTNSQKFPAMKLPKLKGEVTIRLHNPTTGKTEIHKGENMVTNAVADIFSHNYCGAMDYRKFLPLYNTMYGGVLCFANQFQEEELVATDYFIPDASANPLTAHAGQTTLSSQGDDYTRGNPSDGNVNIIDGKATLAWEWGVSGGNGTINSIALTHKDVGDAGLGSSSSVFQNMKPVINCNFGLTYGSLSGSLSYVNPFMFIGSDDYAYRFYCSGNTVTIVKIPFSYTKTRLTASKPFFESLSTTHNVTTTTSFVDVYMPLWFYDKTTDKLWLFYSRNSGTHIDCERIDLSTFLATHIDITTAQSAGPFYNDGRYSGGTNYGYSGTQMPYYNGSVYLGVADSTHTTRFYRINLSNMADQGYINGQIQPFGGAFRPDKSNRILVGKRFVINNGTAYPTSYDTPDSWGTQPYHAGVGTYPFMDDQIGISTLAGQFNGGSSNQYYVAVSKFYLGTKYNLQDEVHKTPSQSMLITYTLTEVEPEEEQEEEEE